MENPMPEKKEKKQMLDMTTDEMADYLFPKEVVEHLKSLAQGETPPPKGKGKSPKVNNVSTQEE
jgi:hypothetical protein